MISDKLVQLLGRMLDSSIRNDSQGFNRNNALFDTLFWNAYPEMMEKPNFDGVRVDNARQSCLYALNGMSEIALPYAFKRYIEICGLG
jgi:hypothetical protein